MYNGKTNNKCFFFLRVRFCSRRKNRWRYGKPIYIWYVGIIYVFHYQMPFVICILFWKIELFCWIFSAENCNRRDITYICIRATSKNCETPKDSDSNFLFVFVCLRVVLLAPFSPASKPNENISACLMRPKDSKCRRRHRRHCSK